MKYSRQFIFNKIKQQFQKKPILLAGLGFTLSNIYQEKQYKCCGIIGAISQNSDVEKILIEGIQILQNRGYDSAGMSTIIKGAQEITTTKLASQLPLKLDCIEEISKIAPKIHQNSICGIAHTRWATCGGKTDANSHPHLDYSNSLSIVHNGTLDNFEQLRDQLIKEHNIELRSETDSEIIAHILQIYKQKLQLSLKDTLKHVIENEIIEGQWGLVIIEKEKPDQMIVARRGSPIEIGIGQNTIYVASEKIAFQKYTSKFISLNENEIIKLELKNIQNLVSDQSRIKTESHKIQVQTHPKPPFESFFEQEMQEQPDTILKTLGNGARLGGPADSCKLGGLEKHTDELENITSLTIVACGSSHQASNYAASFLKKLQCLNTVQCIEGSEFCEYDLPLGNSAIVLVSQSGETADLRRALKIAQDKGIFTIGIINAVGSQIATNVDCGIYLNCGREVAVAATKSFTSQVTALILMSIWLSKLLDKKNQFAKKRRDLVQALQLLPVNIGSTLSYISETCKECAKFMAKLSTIICLGKGPCCAIAKEGALKIKELTYIHAEAFAAGELKHGPLALIDPDKPKTTCIILIILDNEFLNDMNLCLSEVHSRGALTVIITDCKEKITLDKSDFVIEITNSGVLTSLLCVLAFQKITLEICKVQGKQPDKPRNLAKTVTTQ